MLAPRESPVLGDAQLAVVTPTTQFPTTIAMSRDAGSRCWSGPGSTPAWIAQDDSLSESATVKSAVAWGVRGGTTGLQPRPTTSADSRGDDGRRRLRLRLGEACPPARLTRRWPRAARRRHRHRVVAAHPGPYPRPLAVHTGAELDAMLAGVRLGPTGRLPAPGLRGAVAATIAATLPERRPWPSR